MSGVKPRTVRDLKLEAYLRWDTTTCERDIDNGLTDASCIQFKPGDDGMRQPNFQAGHMIAID